MSSTPLIDNSAPIYVGAQRNPLLESFFRQAGCRPADQGLAVHKSDEMWLYALGLHDHDQGQALVLYHRSGLSAWRLLRSLMAWRFGSAAETPSWLDFAAGFGRITRFALTEVDPRRLVVSEIDARALAFQRDQYGVGTQESSPDATDFVSRQSFSFVSTLSFFTHTPRSSFGLWLAQLWKAVADGGMLLFSTADLSRLDSELRSHAKQGFFFEMRSERDDLDAAAYGTSWCSEEFVRARIIECCPDATGVFHLPKGLWDHQDLWLVTRGGAPSDGPPWRVDLAGFLDQCEILGPREFVVSGWAIDPMGTEAPLVRIFLGESLRIETTTTHPRLDVVAAYGPNAAGGGWRAHVRTAEPFSGAEVLTVTAQLGERECTVFHVSHLFGADASPRRTVWSRQLDQQARTYQQLLATTTWGRLTRFTRRLLRR